MIFGKVVLSFRYFIRSLIFCRALQLLICFLLFTIPIAADPKINPDSIARFEADFEQRTLWYSLSNFSDDAESNQSFWVNWETGEEKSTSLSRLWTSSSPDRIVCYGPPGRKHHNRLYYVTEAGRQLCVESGDSNPTTPHTAFNLNRPYGRTRLALAGQSDWLALNVSQFVGKKWQLAIYHWNDLIGCIENPREPFNLKSANICNKTCSYEKCDLGRHYTVHSGSSKYLVREHFEADIGVHPKTKALRVVYQLGIAEEKSKTVNETLRLVEVPADEPLATKDDFEIRRDLSKRPFVEIGEKDPEFSNGWKGHPRFSPDGKWIAYIATKKLHDESAEMELLVTPASGTMEEIGDASSVNITSQMNRPVTNFQWSCNSQCILFQVSSQGDRPLYQANLHLKTGNWEMPTIDSPVVSGVSTITQFEASEDGLELIALNSSLSTPPSIVRLQRYGPWKTGHFHCDSKTVREQCQMIAMIPHVFDSVVAHKESVPPISIAGHPVDYFVVRSHKCTASALCPLVVRVHGGPNGVWESAFDPITYELAESGYVVLLPNPTGSIGFGQAFTDAVKGKWGGTAVDDVVRVINDAIELPFVDHNRIYGMGNSYGGYMMNYFLVDGQSSAKTQPKFRFNAIVTINGVWDLRDFACNTDQPWFAFDQLGFAKGDSACDLDGPLKLIDFNPVDRIEHLKSIPTLVIYSKDDSRVPAEKQNMALYEELKKSPDSGSPSPLELEGGHSLLDSQQYTVLEESLKHFDAHQ